MYTINTIIKMTLLLRTVFLILFLNNIFLSSAQDDEDVTLTVDGTTCNTTKNLDDASYLVHWTGHNFSPSCSYTFKPTDENHKVCVEVDSVEIDDCQVSIKLYFFKSDLGSPSVIFNCSNNDEYIRCGALSEYANITFTSPYSMGDYVPYDFQSSEFKMAIYEEYTMPVYLILIIVFAVVGFLAIVTTVIIVVIVKNNKRNRIQGKVISNGRTHTTGYNSSQRQQQGQQQQQQSFSLQGYPHQQQYQQPLQHFTQQPQTYNQPHHYNRLPPLNQPQPYPSATGPIQVPSSSQYTNEQLYGIQPSAPSEPPPAYSPAMADGFSQPAQEKF